MTEHDYFPPIEVETAASELQATIELLDSVSNSHGSEMEASSAVVRTAVQRYIYKLPVLKQAALLLAAADRLKVKAELGELSLVPSLSNVSDQYAFMSRQRALVNVADIFNYASSVERLSHILSKWNVALEASQDKFASSQFGAVAETLVSSLRSWKAPYTEIQDVDDEPLGIDIQTVNQGIPTTITTLASAGVTYFDLVLLSSKVETAYKKIRHILLSRARLMTNDITIINYQTSAFIAQAATVSIMLLNQSLKIGSAISADMGLGTVVATESAVSDNALDDVVDGIKDQHSRLVEALKHVEHLPSFVSLKQQHRLRNILKVATTGLDNIHRRFLETKVDYTPQTLEQLDRFNASLIEGIKDRTDISENPGMVKRTGSETSRKNTAVKLDHLLDLYLSSVLKIKSAIEKMNTSDDKYKNKVITKCVAIVHKLSKEIVDTGEFAIKKFNTHKEE